MQIEYTPEERRVILYVLSEIMLADEHIHPKEQMLFDNMFHTLKADSSDLDTMEHIDDMYAKATIKKMCSEKKENLNTLFNEMALADDYLDIREQDVIDYYTK